MMQTPIATVVVMVVITISTIASVVMTVVITISNGGDVDADSERGDHGGDHHQHWR
jgi:hypothetical protein